MIAVSVLGDSLTCGRGVGVRVPEHETWPALLAGSTPGIEVRSLALPGARIADVRRSQLPMIPPERASGGVVVLIAGLNDIGRSGFDPGQIQRELSLIVSGAQELGAAVVLGRLHDPTALLGLPGAVRAAIARRLAVVNDAVDAAAGGEVHVLDLASVSALGCRGGWATDRIHPSRSGHHAIACAVAQLLAEAGFASGSRMTVPSQTAGPSALQTAWWALRHGLPYGITHLPDFGPPLLAALAARVGATG